MLFPSSPSKSPTQVIAAEGPFGVLVERRRSPRRTLHRPCEVHLQGIGDETEWRCRGVLLNLSIGGLACRVTTEHARLLWVDQFVDALFHCSASPNGFDLRARITNITPAGSAEHHVLGLEFVDDSRLRASHSALREAIAQAIETKG